MRYQCFGYYDPDAFDERFDEEQQEIGAICRHHDAALHEPGAVLEVASLEMPDRTEPDRAVDRIALVLSR